LIWNFAEINIYYQSSGEGEFISTIRTQCYQRKTKSNP